MESSSRRRLLGCLLFAAIGSACASIMGVEEASVQEPDASSSDGGQSTSDGAPSDDPFGAIGSDACAGEGCPCTDDSQCRDEPYRKCVAGKCAECTTEPDSCPLGRYCQGATDAGTGSNRCTLGCKSNSDCETLSPAARQCHPDRHQCVECIGEGDCLGNKQCSPSGTCADKCTNDGGTCPMPNETCCSGLCVDLTTDIFNCNACGTTCGGGTPVCCSGQCKDSQVDPSNCGGCSKTCKVAAGAPVCAGGACLPATCNDILANTPDAKSGIYVVDPDGSGGASSFSVYCDMTTDGGGWTLVGRELPFATGTFRFLAAETPNPSGLAEGTASGLLGKRFSGKYTQVWIAWANDRYIRFRIPNNFDFFANAVQLNVNLPEVATNDPSLNNWFRGGAKACIASRLSDVRPGDTSWAIKPRSDNYTNCGCNNGSWAGRGAYYGGTLPPNHTACDGWGGGWAGARDNGQQKGGIGPDYETRIYVR